jgi:GNAT superfamily N-acetyltransferase
VSIEEWWPEAAAAARGVREPVPLDGLHRMIDEVGAGTLVIARAEDSAPIGLLVYRLATDGWLEFRFLALAQGLRGWGYGSEAVRLIEESGRAQRFVARVSGGNGLGLYFWLRMGYRPGELPWQEREPEDKIAMIRGQKE